MEHSQMNFKEIRLVLLLFLQLHPLYASQAPSPIPKKTGKTGKRLGFFSSRKVDFQVDKRVI